MVLGTLGGMAVTYLNNGKLFLGPHLLVSLGILMLAAVAADATRTSAGTKAHMGLNMGLMTLYSLAGKL